MPLSPTSTTLFSSILSTVNVFILLSSQSCRVLISPNSFWFRQRSRARCFPDRYGESHSRCFLKASAHFYGDVRIHCFCQRISPESGVNSPIIDLKSVVFPAPFCPTTPKCSLLKSSKLAFLYKSLSPKECDKFFTSKSPINFHQNQPLYIKFYHLRKAPMQINSHH